MRKSYRLYGHEKCNAHVVIFFDETVSPNRIELWSNQIYVCGAYRGLGGIWKIFCTGTYSKTTKRQISWFSQQPKHSHCEWKLSLDCFNEISEKCRHGIRNTTDEELICIYDLICQYIRNGKHYPGFE